MMWSLRALRSHSCPFSGSTPVPASGTCALRGCDPKKMLIAGAEVIDATSRMRGHGVVGDERIDWPDLMAFKRTFTDSVPAKNEHR